MKPYKVLLKEYIDNSGLSLREISRQCEDRGTPVSQAYISKILNTETLPPPSESVSRVIADVTGGDPDELVLSGFLDRAPQEIRELYEKSELLNNAYELIEGLPGLIKEYHGKVPVDVLTQYLEYMKQLGLNTKIGTFWFNPLKQFKTNKELIEKQLEELKLKPKDKITANKIKELEKNIISDALKKLTNELSEEELKSLTDDLYDLFVIRKNRIIESKLSEE